MVGVVVGDNLATQSNNSLIRGPKSLGNREIATIIDQPHDPGIAGKGSNFSL
jgi:hypothetical protein